MNAADWVSVADLVAWDKNPKPHGQDNIKEIARSIRRFDFGAPIVAWRSKRQVVAGHGRLLGASLLMREDPGRLLATDAPAPGLVPVRWMEFASESEAAAYALADNRLTEVNPMTDAAVADILREIEAEGGDINVPGYSEDDLKALLAPDVADVPDPGAEEPDPQGEPDSKLGEVYELGPHRLVCGDSTQSEVWDKLSIENRESMVFTSPPYNAGTSANLRGRAASGPDSFYLESDDVDWTALMNGWTAIAVAVVEVVVCNVQMLAGNKIHLLKYLCDWSARVHDVAVWDKGRCQPAFIHSVLNSQYEFVIILGKEGATRKIPLSEFHGDVSNVFQVGAQSANEFSDIHRATMPIELPLHVFSIFRHAKLVVDPFGGSGTTLIACAQTGRAARLIEIDPRYCDVIRRRWTKWAREAGVDPGPGRLE